MPEEDEDVLEEENQCKKAKTGEQNSSRALKNDSISYEYDDSGDESEEGDDFLEEEPSIMRTFSEEIVYNTLALLNSGTINTVISDDSAVESDANNNKNSQPTEALSSSSCANINQPADYPHNHTEEDKNSFPFSMSVFSSDSNSSSNDSIQRERGEEILISGTIALGSLAGDL